MLIIESEVAVDLLTDALTGTILVVRITSGFFVGVLVDANVNVFAGLMTGFEIAILGPLEVVCC